jgi:electron transport complex protein RnfG
MATIFKSGLTLAAIAAVCTSLVALTWTLTQQRIADNQQAYLERSLQPALGDVAYDTGILDARIEIPQPHEVPGSGAAVVYRVYNNGEPAAALFVVTARDGYAGPIKFLLGVTPDGTVAGVHVLEHRETPGLGDGISADVSDWPLQFRGRAIGNPVVERWGIKDDGGEFDQLTGASVTPRAMVKAIRKTLLYFNSNRDLVFARETAP